MAVQDWNGSWRLDPDRTELTFRSRTLWGLANVKGVFTKADGTGQASAPDLVSGRLEIDAASVSTGIRQRDAHLRSADFFDVEAFPKIEFVVDSAVLTDSETVELHGELMIKGIGRRLDLSANVTKLDDGALRLATTTTVNRREFGVDGNLVGMIGDTAWISADAVFTPHTQPSP
jgi:polyisoprenoid-binding protein YceI